MTVSRTARELRPNQFQGPRQTGNGGAGVDHVDLYAAGLDHGSRPANAVVAGGVDEGHVGEVDVDLR